MPAAPKYLSASTVAERWGMSTDTVYRMVQDRELPSYRIRRSCRFLESDILAYEKKARRPARGEH